MNQPKILLTGATGFVGRQILKGLEADGASVRLVVRDGSVDRVSPGDVRPTADLFAESADWWAEALAGIDTVVHAAWYTEPGRYLSSPLNLDCLAGTIALAQGAVRAGVKRFVGVGTCFEYDLSFGDIDIDTPIAPTTPYAAAKAAVFTGLSSLLPAAGISFAWCRLFYLYGDGEDERRLVPYLHSRLKQGEAVDLTSGTQVRDFMDVADAGRRIATAALGPVIGPVNVCSGQAVTVRQLAEGVADLYGRRDLLRFGVRPDNAVDPARVVGVPTRLDTAVPERP